MNFDKEIVGLITGNFDEIKKGKVLREIKADKEKFDQFCNLKNLWALSSAQKDLTDSQIERSFDRLRGKIFKSNTHSTKRLFISIIKYAAVVAIAFISGKAIYSHYFDKNNISQLETHYFLDEQTNQQQLPATGKTRDQLSELFVPPGQKAEINLPDGSHVWVNSNTRLAYEQGFSNKNRILLLDGEAYFEVKKNDRPFIVSTRYGRITAVGTSFNIYAYENSPFQATIISGSVYFENARLKHGRIKLTPPQQLSLYDSDRLIIKEVDTAQCKSWMKGQIAFENEPMDELLKKLSRHYGLKIVLTDSALGKVCFTGHIENETIHNFLDYVNVTKPINYQFDESGNVLTISSR
jgi:hypothetical protein